MRARVTVSTSLGALLVLLWLSANITVCFVIVLETAFVLLFAWNGCDVHRINYGSAGSFLLNSSW